MFGNTLLVLPFGLLPFVLFIVWMLYFKGADSAQKNIGSRARNGLTEYPLELSACLTGDHCAKDKLEFTSDGRSIIWTIYGSYNPVTQSHDGRPTASEIKDWMMELLRNERSNGIDDSWVDHYQIEKVQKLSDPQGARITVSMDDTVQSESYIAHEIKNLGRVFMVNSTTNNFRWLSFSNDQNRIDREDGRLMVYIERNQTVPGFLDSAKEVIMSEKQITRNIKNRLWNRVDVRCISINDSTYCGEILPG